MPDLALQARGRGRRPGPRRGRGRPAAGGRRRAPGEVALERVGAAAEACKARRRAGWRRRRAGQAGGKGSAAPASRPAPLWSFAPPVGEGDLAGVETGGVCVGALRLVAGEGERFDQAFGFADLACEVGVGRRPPAPASVRSRLARASPPLRRTGSRSPSSSRTERGAEGGAVAGLRPAAPSLRRGARGLRPPGRRPRRRVRCPPEICCAPSPGPAGAAGEQAGAGGGGGEPAAQLADAARGAVELAAQADERSGLASPSRPAGRCRFCAAAPPCARPARGRPPPGRRGRRRSVVGAG